MGLPSNSTAENVLATIGTICWTVQLIPQIWKSWREKSTDGLAPWLVLIWGLSSPFLGVYVIVQDLNIPLIIQPQAFGVLGLISWSQCLYYGSRRSFRTCIATLVTLLTFSAGFEVGMVYAVRPSFRKGHDGGVQFFGIVSAVMIALALIPQFVEIFRRREVVGISVLFMLIDWLGGIFSTLSLIFKKKFDVIAAMSYLLVVFLDGAVLLLALILNPRAKRRRALEEAENSIANDEISPSPTIHVSAAEEKADVKEDTNVSISLRNETDVPV